MDAFNFSKEQPADEVISVMQKTNKLSTEVGSCFRSWPNVSGFMIEFVLFKQYETLLDIVFSVLGDMSTANKVEEKLEDFASSNGIKVTPLKNMSKVLLIVGNGENYV